jgi:hypothetical protein
MGDNRTVEKRDEEAPPYVRLWLSLALAPPLVGSA